ncbi:TPA: helix-turn-helix domain-containing protein [Streptococcus suis]|nr:helix-turn-helix domain-containing protein [Streptococcus suis]HEM4885720.1 helix-turn-helix domain-containing protein [Streptococcus suis]
MNRLKILRKEKGLSQQALAKEIGVSYRTLQNWENGVNTIKPDKAQALADHFGVSVGYLLGYSDFKNNQELVQKIHADFPKDVAWKVSGSVVKFGELPLEKINQTYGESLSASLINLLGLLSFHDRELETIYKFLALGPGQQEAIHDLTVKLFNLNNSNSD